METWKDDIWNVSIKLEYDVIIIGAGPTGIGAATALKKLGIHNIVIIEREEHPGGVLAYSQLPTFGTLLYKCPMTGQQLANKILSLCDGVEILTETTVTTLLPAGGVVVSSSEGAAELFAKRIILATGAQETPNESRFLTGSPLTGIFTTESLQRSVYLEQQKPCHNPVIIGSELVSFSALWTLRQAGITPQAMIEKGPTIASRNILRWAAKLTKTPIHYNSQLLEIGGQESVEYIHIERNGQQETINCDAVILTGEFSANMELIRQSHLDHDPLTGRPLVDAVGRCSDGVCFAIGNMMHPADMGEHCYQEGHQIGTIVGFDLRKPPVKNSVRRAIKHDENILFTVPNCLMVHGDNLMFDLNFRVTREIKGKVVIKCGKKVLYKNRRHCLPGRRIMLENIKLKINPKEAGDIYLSIE